MCLYTQDGGKIRFRFWDSTNNTIRGSQLVSRVCHAPSHGQCHESPAVTWNWPRLVTICLHWKLCWLFLSQQMWGENSHVRPETEIFLAEQLHRTGFQQPRCEMGNVEKTTKVASKVNKNNLKNILRPLTFHVVSEKLALGATIC